MTTVVYCNGVLAADSRTSSAGSLRSDDRVVKLYKLKGLTYQGVNVPWMGCAGNSADINRFRTILETGGDLEALLAEVNRYQVGSFTLSALLLLETGHCLCLGKGGGAKDNVYVRTYTPPYKDSVLLNPKSKAWLNDIQLIGSGSRNGDLITHLKIDKATVACKILSTLDVGSGGRIVYVKPGYKDIRVYKGISETRRNAIASTFSKLFE